MYSSPLTRMAHHSQLMAEIQLKSGEWGRNELPAALQPRDWGAMCGTESHADMVLAGTTKPLLPLRLWCYVSQHLQGAVTLQHSIPGKT